MPKKTPPKVTHRHTAQIEGKIKRVAGKFAADIIAHLKAEILKDPQYEYNNPTNEFLLKKRKALVASVKKGMLARKNQEIEIASLAMIIWLNRLTKQEIERLLEW